MKLLIFSLTFLSIFASAFASQMPIVRGTELDQMKVHKNHFSNINVSAASISVDHTNKILRLHVNGVVKKLPEMCNRPNGPACGIFGSADVELAITKDVKTLCTRTYTAEIDKRPVDGNKQVLVVTEFQPARNARCIGRLPTVVTYTSEGFSRMTGTAVKGKSTFSGPKMKRVLLAEPVEGPFIP